MGILEGFRNGVNVAFSPDEHTKKRMDIGEALGFYYKFIIIPLIAAIVIPIIAGIASGHAFLGYEFAAFGAVMLLVEPLGGFLTAALVHFFGKSVFRKFKNSYEDSYTAIIYGAMPGNIFAWLLYTIMIFISKNGFLMPNYATGLGIAVVLVDIALSIWGFVVLMYAFANQQKCSKLAAIGVYLGMIAIFFAIVVTIIVIIVLATLTASHIV